MKMFLLGLLLVAGFALGGAPMVQAAVPQQDCTNHPNGGGTDPNGNPYVACPNDNIDPTAAGSNSVTLSQQLYCQSKSVMSGNLGLLVGLIVALFGLYQMVNGALAGGFILLICGALITALPSLVESTMQGVYSFSAVFRSGSTNGGSGGTMCVPTCSGGQVTGTTGNCTANSSAPANSAFPGF